MHAISEISGKMPVSSDFNLLFCFPT